MYPDGRALKEIPAEVLAVITLAKAIACPSNSASTSDSSVPALGSVSPA